ncbi:MAG: hypothetical protein KAS32_28490 [Candidatus Peribacteraceae bacterium]|nr:hypothetical protein [Candidatus Peribacteraceae bacterium]
MNIQLWQLESLFVYFMLIITIVYSPQWGKVLAVALMVIMFALNPFRYAQEGMAQAERETNRFTEIPEKVIVKEESYQQSSERELEQLKIQSEGRKDEIHN